MKSLVINSIFLKVSFALLVNAQVLTTWAQRPNVVYIFTDQHTAMAMSCAGNPDLKTPNLDRLANKGYRFERAYVTNPLCTPSRASMMSGRMPHEVGIRGNEGNIGDQFLSSTLGLLLKRGGYECAYGGKWHLPQISVPDSVYGFRNISDFNDFKLAERSANFIKGKHSNPFLLVASFDNPHAICEWARNETLPWGNVEEPARLSDCPNLPANFAIPAFEPEVIREVWRSSTKVHPVVTYTDEDWRRYRYAYYRLVEKVDADIGKILDALEQSGVMENTLIIFSSDHGDGNAAHHWNQKSVLYEESIRVPFIIKPPESLRNGIVDNEHLISNGLDLLPTICDYAGIAKPDGLKGYSLMPLISGRKNVPWRDVLFVETNWAEYGINGRAVVGAKYKYMVYNKGKYKEQLVDLKSDPGEMVNLAIERKHESVLQEYRSLLFNWCENTNDNFGFHYSKPKGSVNVPGFEYRSH